MRYQLTRSVLVTAALATGVAGCGGSSSSGLSKADLAKQVNAICANYNAKIKAVPQPSDIATNATSAATFFDKVAPLFDESLTKFKALKPADSVKSQYDDFLTKVGALASVIDQLKAKADAKDRTGIALLPQIQPATNAANSAANSIGATTCSQ
jgi:hypothetical protein